MEWSRIQELLETLGINIALIIAGFFGSLVSMGNRKKLSRGERFIAWFSGGAIANYLTPFIVSMVNISEGSQYGFAFLLGFSGLEGVKWLIYTLKNKYSKDKENE